MDFRAYGRLLFTYLRPQWGRVALLAALLAGSLSLQLINPQILRRFIDTAANGAARDRLPAMALLFILLALVQQLLATTSRYVAEDVGWAATNRLRQDLLAHCLRLGPAFHKRHTPGELMERLDGDVSLLATFLSRMIVDLAGNALLLLGILALLLREDWRAGLAMALFASGAIGLLAVIRNVAVPHYRALRELVGEFFGFLGETLTAREDVRSSGAEPYVMSRFSTFQRQWLTLRRRAVLRGISVWGTGLTLVAVGAAVSLSVGGYLYGQGLITLGTVYLLFHYTELLSGPIQQIRTQIQELQSAGAGIARVLELLDTRPPLEDGPGALLPDGALSVAFDQVTFGYDGVHVFANLSFALQPGQILGLLGRTGAGKTTISRLLLRQYDPDSGAITLGGVNIRQPHLRHLRRRVGMVTQHVQILYASVRDNITFYDRTVSDGKLLAILTELGLTPWLQSLPRGLDTILDPSGLSAGEAQLLAFARLFLQDPGLVILDEASSRLDPATEALIERAITRLLHGRTAIIIAHRKHTLERADSVLLLGEEGTLQEVLA